MQGRYANFLTPVSMHMKLDAQNHCVPNRMVTGLSGPDMALTRTADVGVSIDAKQHKQRSHGRR
jgi:hypothetical protein